MPGSGAERKGEGWGAGRSSAPARGWQPPPATAASLRKGAAARGRGGGQREGRPPHPRPARPRDAGRRLELRRRAAAEWCSAGRSRRDLLLLLLLPPGALTTPGAPRSAPPALAAAGRRRRRRSGVAAVSRVPGRRSPLGHHLRGHPSRGVSTSLRPPPAPADRRDGAPGLGAG